MDADRGACKHIHACIEHVSNVCSAYMYVCIHVSIGVCIYIYIYIYMYVCMRVCVYEYRL